MFKFDILGGSILLLFFKIIGGLEITAPNISNGLIAHSDKVVVGSIVNDENRDICKLLNMSENTGFFIYGAESSVGLSVSLNSASTVINNRLTFFNSFSSAVAPVYTISSSYIDNDGNFYIVSNYPSESPTISIPSPPSWSNTGLIVFDSNAGKAAIINFEAAITNSGQIHILNSLYEQAGSISGTGCITLADDTSFYLTNTSNPISSTQQFYLADNSSSITVSTSITSTINVAGFGNGNHIGIDGLVSGFHYSSATGILSISSYHGKTIYFYIGTGYEASLFWEATSNPYGLSDLSYTVISYNGPSPNSVPSICKPYIPMSPIIVDYNSTSPTTNVSNTLSDETSQEIFVTLKARQTNTYITMSPTSDSATTYTTTFTTTDSNGYVATDSGVVVVSVDSPVTETSTSLFPTSSDPDTTYTTTFTTTDSNGYVATDSGVVIVSVDSSRTETTTSLFPTSSDPDTTYTTTFTTTDSNGYVATDSGIVIVSVDSSGTETNTSLFPTSSDPDTTYTTTFTTTDSNGYIATDSGVVVINVNHSGTLTSTSLFPTSSDPDTTYTTTFTTTDSNGYIATDSGVVVININHSGTLTSTSLFPTSSDPDTTYTTTFTTTDSNEYVATDSGVVVISVDSSGTEASTSLFPTSSDPDTTYTTTFTITESDGFVATDSGVVVVSAGSDTTVTSTSLFSISGLSSSTTSSIDLRVSSSGSSSTFSSVNYFNSSSSISDTFTEYTTTFTSTESNGVIDTDSGVVIVSTNSDGRLYTCTSLYPTSSSSSTTASFTSSGSSIQSVSSSSATSSSPSTSTSSISSSSSVLASSSSPASVYSSTPSTASSISSSTNSVSSTLESSSPTGTSSSSSIFSSPSVSFTISSSFSCTSSLTSFTSSSPSISSTSSTFLSLSSSSSSVYISTSNSYSSEASSSTTSISSLSSSLSSSSLTPSISASPEGLSTSSAVSSSSLSYSSSTSSVPSTSSASSSSISNLSTSVTSSSSTLVSSSKSSSASSTSNSPNSSSPTAASTPTSLSSFNTSSTSITSSSSLSLSLSIYPSAPSSPFTAIDNIAFSQVGSISSAFPFAPKWTATLAWLISDDYSVGDTFSLTLPNVLGIYNPNYGVTKRDTINAIYLEADGMNYAECISVAGSLDAFDSILQCTISEVATSDISGTVELPFVFNVGGSSSASDLEAAKSLSAGIQTISFTSGDGTILSYDVTFDAGSPSPDDPDDIVFVARSLEWDSTNDYYLLGGNCPTSYGFGKLSLTVDDGTLNCDTWEAKITNDLNDWYLPKSAQSFGSISLESCSGNEIVVNYANVPAGYRVFLDVIGSPDGFNIGATYSDEHTCGAAVSGGSSSTFVTTNSAGESVTGTAVVVVTSDITVTVTEPCSQYGTTVVTTLPNGQATTQSAEVIVSTNSGGSLYTTTSIIAGPTEYTTTIVTTDIVGVPCTETGVVIVSSSEGELYTITSVRGGGGTTVYTTTVITTDTVGVPCTETAIVIVSNSEGSLVTTIVGGGVVVGSELSGSPEIGGESITETVAAQSTTEAINRQNNSPETTAGSATPGSPVITANTVATESGTPSVSPKYENTSSNKSVNSFMLVISLISLLMTFIFI